MVVQATVEREGHVGPGEPEHADAVDSSVRCMAREQADVKWLTRLPAEWRAHASMHAPPTRGLQRAPARGPCSGAAPPPHPLGRVALTHTSAIGIGVIVGGALAAGGSHDKSVGALAGLLCRHVHHHVDNSACLHARGASWAAVQRVVLAVALLQQ